MRQLIVTEIVITRSLIGDWLVGDTLLQAVYNGRKITEDDMKQLSPTLFVLKIACLCLLANGQADAQENWSRFHGPNGSGLAADATLPAEVSEDDYLWTAELKGTGSSSPVVWGDNVFVTSCDSKTGELTLQCLSAKTGKENWGHKFKSSPYRVHNRNSFASGTPAIDKDHVYISYASPEKVMVVAFNHKGEKKWDRDFGTWISQHGFGTSLMTYKDKLIFFNSQQAQRVRQGRKPGESNMIAMSCKDGSVIWKTPLKATRSCYAVPGVFTDSTGKDQLISCNTGDGFFSLDPDNGSKNWSTLPFRMRTVASTLVVDGLIIGSSGSGGGGNYLVAIRPDKKGENPPEKAYEIQRANYVPSPVAVDGNLFLFTDKGIGQCFNLQTGEMHWQERIARGFSGSPVATKENIYIMDESGMLYTIAAAKKYKLVGSHALGEASHSTPAIANNQMYLRTESNLICIGTKKK